MKSIKSIFSLSVKLKKEVRKKTSHGAGGGFGECSLHHCRQLNQLRLKILTRRDQKLYRYKH